MAAAVRRTGAACTFLGVLFLVLSQTQIVTRAQQVTIQNATSSAANKTQGLTTEEMSKLLSTMFKEISVKLAAIQGTSTGPLMGPNSTASLRDALNAVVSQQQSLGINTQQMIVEDIAAFLELPSTIGTGTNVKLFQSRIKQFRDLAKSLQSMIPAEQYLRIRRDLNAATQLSLQFVAAFPLAQLAYSASLVSLASGVMSLLGAIFYIVGASLALSAQIGGLAAAKAAGNGGKASLSDQKWVKDIFDKSSAITTPVLAFAFSDQPLNLMKFADGLLGVTDSTFSPLVANTTTSALRFTVPALSSRLG